ncbi:MAG: D-glycero-beta-D-manno-heptose 1-phosphate adenylyltransferase [Nitrospirae bacterium]|nr:D-glycero-beta-D-manno-heptose 1-phosphate adenylyltransferase [Nitrospirota bacterium]
MKKVLDREKLRSVCRGLRSRGRKIVFTNGCFDIIHIGHVRYLKKARGLGDILIVGLNSDSSVSGLKPGRPVNSQSRRAEVLASLMMVDYVTIFDEETPYKLIKSLRPDILVKGGDWKKEDIVGSDIVPETFSLPFTRGVSTTRIIEKIRGLSS